MIHSKYKGVYVKIRKCDGVPRWRVQCGSGGKSMQYLGTYDTEEQAADARQKTTGDRPFSRWHMKQLALAGIEPELDVSSNEFKAEQKARVQMTEFRAEEKATAENLLDGKYDCWHCGQGYEEKPADDVSCWKCGKYECFNEIIVV